jgi:His/Glu/Gln/Arg/opine family amino acid ABC transporter permease subunit
MDVILNEIRTFAFPALFNIYFALAAIPVGFVLAVGMALAKASRNRLVSRLARGYIYGLRGSPFFIQLFMVYSLILSFNLTTWKPMGIDWFILHPLFIGPLVLVLNTTAYTAEIFHGALTTVPRGEIEAARAMGMSRSQVFRRITWPNLIRIAWPAYTNEVVALFQVTALIYFTLPVIDQQKDLMNKAGELFERDYNLFLHFSVAALYFLVISNSLILVFGLIYKRLMRHLPQQPKLKWPARIFAFR